MGLIEQEVSPQRWIDIPDEIREIYRLWRPSPLFRAHRLERALGTPAKIYYKYEGGSPAGSHKPNTAIPQAYYNKIAGTRRIATETGAGQWGSSMALACQMFGLECTVYMVKVSFNQKPYRKSMMQLWGAEVVPRRRRAPTAGRSILAKDPTATVRWELPSAKRWRMPPPARIPATLWGVCSITCACTRRSSVSRPRAVGLSSATTRTWSSAATAAAPTSPASPSPLWPTRPPASRCVSWRWSRPAARP